MSQIKLSRCSRPCCRFVSSDLNTAYGRSRLSDLHNPATHVRKMCDTFAGGVRYLEVEHSAVASVEAFNSLYSPVGRLARCSLVVTVTLSALTQARCCLFQTIACVAAAQISNTQGLQTCSNRSCTALVCVLLCVVLSDNKFRPCVVVCLTADPKSSLLTDCSQSGVAYRVSGANLMSTLPF